MRTSPSAATFACSNDLFNRIQEMTRRTFLSNIFSVQSDCPHREKFGYGGDLVATTDAFLANFDMAGFYAKAAADWADAARPDGMLTDTAPFVGHPVLRPGLGHGPSAPPGPSSSGITATAASSRSSTTRRGAGSTS